MSKKFAVATGALCALAFFLAGQRPPWAPARPVAASIPGPALRDAALERSIRAAFVHAPLQFEENVGQTDQRVRYVAGGSNFMLFLTPEEAALRLHTPYVREKKPRQLDSEGQGWADAMSATSVVRLRFAGGNPSPRLTGLDPQPGVINYMRGNDPKRWQKNVPHFARVRYEAIYPGVDAVFYGDRRQMEYDFIVAPGADPGAIRMRLEGAASISLTDDGGMEARTPAGIVSVLPPKLYQNLGDNQEYVAGRYVQLGPDEIGFEVDEYDHNQALVIDPPVNVNQRRIQNRARRTGRGPVKRSSPPDSDPPTGGSVGFSTVLGGTADDSIQAIAIGATPGAVFVAGFTDSPDFPQAGGANSPQDPFGASCMGIATPAFPCGDAFVALFNVSVSPPQLVAVTLIGGSGDDVAWGMALDSQDNPYLVGETNSGDFPTTDTGRLPSLPPAGCFTSGTQRPCHHGFLVVLDTNLSSNLIYGTYLAGSDDDAAYAVAIDDFDDAFVTGSAGANFVDAFNQYSGAGDAFVMGIVTCSTDLDDDCSPFDFYSRYIGGTGTDAGLAIDVDSLGNDAYVGGVTYSTDSDSGQFPTTSNALQTVSDDSQNCGPGSRFSCGDGFVAEVGSDGGDLDYLTFIGGSDADQVNGIASKGVNAIYITGQTRSPDFVPVQISENVNDSGPLQDYAGGIDAFVVKFFPVNSTSIGYATFVGGSGDDIGNGIAFDTSGDVFISGSTTSTDLQTFNALQSFSFGNGSTPTAFLSVIDQDGENFLIQTYYGGSFDNAFNSPPSDAATSIALDTVGNIYLAGRTTSYTNTANFFPGLCLVNQPQFTNNDEQAFADYNGFLAIIIPTTSSSPTSAGASACFTPSPQVQTVQFPDTLQGMSSDPQLVTIVMNQGSGTLANTVTFTGPNAADFTELGSDGCGTVGGGGNTCVFNVIFKPTTATLESATMVVTNNSSGLLCSTPTQCTFDLSGQGLTQATATLAPNPLTFAGTTVAGQQNPTFQIATLTNTTTATATPLNISTIALGGTNAADFAIQPSASTCNAGGQVGFDTSCQIAVSFMPQAAGTRSATLTVTDDAVGGAQTINITGTAVPPPAVISVPPLSLLFSGQGIGTMSTAQTVTITNSAATGAASLTVSGLTFTGANPGDFAATGCAAAVAPGGTCVISVTFTPTVAGARSATLQIASNATNGLQTIAVSGTGLAAPTATPSGAVTFPPQAVNSTSVPMNVSLTNSGGSALSITSVALSGGDAADFAVVSNGCGTSLGAGTTCIVSLTFTPPSIATFATSLVFTDALGTQTVAISGTGVAGSAGALTLSAPLFFGAVLVGSTSPAQTVTVTNTGGSQITITGVTTTAGSDFAVTNGCTAPVNPGTSCTVGVTFAPTANGTRTGMLTITYNAPGSPQALSLSGIGATINIAPVAGGTTTLTVTPGDTAQYNLSISGTQGLVVALNLMCSSSAPATLCSVSPASVVLGGPTPPTVLVTVQTNCVTTVQPGGAPARPFGPSPVPPPFAMLWVGSLALLSMLRRWMPQARLMRVAPVLLLLLLVVTWTGCVNNPPPAIPGAPTTPAGTYNITVTASTGAGSGQNITKQLALVLRVI